MESEAKMPEATPVENEFLAATLAQRDGVVLKPETGLDAGVLMPMLDLSGRNVKVTDEERRVQAEALSREGPDVQAAVILRGCGLSLQAIADRLKTPLATVHGRLERFCERNPGMGIPMLTHDMIGQIRAARLLEKELMALDHLTEAKMKEASAKDIAFVAGKMGTSQDQIRKSKETREKAKEEEEVFSVRMLFKREPKELEA